MHLANICSLSGRHLTFLALVLTLLAVPLTAEINSNAALDVTRGNITIPHAASLDLSPRVTIEAWVKPIPPTREFGVIVDKDYSWGFALGLTSIAGRTDSVDITANVTGSAIIGPRIVSDSLTWTHIAATIDTTAHQIVFYVNGVQVSASVDPRVRFVNNTQALRIGRSTLGDVFQGMCDEIRIWNVIRSEPEIAALWNHEAKGNEPGLVAVYHFEDVRDTIAWNRSASGGLNGTLSGTGLFISEPRPDAFIDENEPNGNYATATPVNYGSFLQNAAIAPADTDYFKIWIGSGDVFRVESAPKNAGDPGDMMISIYSGDTVLHVTTHSGGYPKFYTAASVSGYRYIQVVNKSGAGGNYTLRVQYMSETFVPDEYEPNNVLSEAVPRAWGVTSYGTIFPGADAQVAVRDTDYYAYTANAGEIGWFIHTYQGYGCGSGYASLRDESGVIPSTFPSSYLNYRFPASGTYYLRIVPNEATYRYFFGGFKGLADIHDMLYDPVTVGSGTLLRSGMNNAYTNAYILKINGSAFKAVPDYQATELDGRQFVFGPATMSGLSVARKFFVPSAAQGDTLGYMRIQDVLTNTTASPITVNVAVYSDLGANPSKVIASSTGDTLFAAEDRWLWTDDNSPSSGRPNLLHIYDGVGGRDRVDSVALERDELYWEWKDVTVGPGETKIYMYIVAQDSFPAWAEKRGPAFSGSVLPATATLGLGSDARLVMNWPTDALVSADEQDPLPLIFTLEQNYPNPFNPKTVVSCQLPVASDVRLVVYDLLGREVAVLMDEHKEAGTYRMMFDASMLSTGVYFYRMTSGDFVECRKMLLVK